MALVFYKFHSLSVSKTVFQFLTYRLLKNVFIIHSNLVRLIFDHARICVYVQLQPCRSTVLQNWLVHKNCNLLGSACECIGSVPL